MTNLLIKIFIRGDKDVSDPTVRTRYAVLASTTGIFINLLLFAGKLVFGLFALSVAIIADAFNNVSDAGSSLVALVGFRMAGKHEDKKHPLGHGRSEYISAFIVDMLIILVGFELLKSSFEKILTPALPEVSIATVAVLGAAIFLKGWLFFFYRKIGKIISSQTLKSAALDSVSDVVATTLVLVSALVARYAGLAVDGYAGLAVAAFILFTGFRAAKETIDLLLGAPPDPKFIQDIYAFVKNYPEIIGIHDVMVHDYGPNRQIVSFHAEVPANADINYAHDIIDCLERDMKKKFGCITTVHLDPIVTNDERINRMRELVERSAKAVDPEFSVHDFRMTSGGKHVNLIFDLCVPTDSKWKNEDAAKAVEEKIKSENPDCYAVINAEHPFV